MITKYPRHCACCGESFEPGYTEQTVCAQCGGHTECCRPVMIEVSREEWDELTPDQREARNISVVRNGNVRLPVNKMFRVRKPPIKL